MRLGRPAWVLQVYAVQNILAWILLAVLLRRWLPAVSLRHWAAWCGCLFANGLISSVRQSLTEGPGLALIALAVVSSEQGRSLLAAALLGVSGLGRETNLLAAPAIVSPFGFNRGLRVRQIGMAIVIVGPALLWIGYLRLLLGPEVFSAGSNLTVPFKDAVTKIAATIRELRFDGWSSPALHSALALASLGVQATYLTWRAEWHSRWWRVGMPYVALATVLAGPVWAGHPGAFTRVLLPMTVAFNVLLPSSRWFWPILILGNLSVVAGFALLLSGLPR